FRPKNPFDTPITLRHLMTHRAGLVREPPVGNYFDSVNADLGKTVESLNQTTLLYAPGTKIKYSNSGVAVVGYVLEKTQGQPFAKYVRENTLDLLGMKRSDFQPTPDVQKNLAKAIMWTLGGREFPAPTFELGRHARREPGLGHDADGEIQGSAGPVRIDISAAGGPGEKAGRPLGVERRQDEVRSLRARRPPVGVAAPRRDARRTEAARQRLRRG